MGDCISSKVLSAGSLWRLVFKAKKLENRYAIPRIIHLKVVWSEQYHAASPKIGYMNSAQPALAC